MRVNQSVMAILATFSMAMASLPASAESKIGIVDPQRAIMQSEIGKQSVEQIIARFSEQDEMLKENNKEITTLLEKLKKDTELMSDQEFQNLLQEIGVKQNQNAQGLQEINRAKSELSQRVIQSLTPRFSEAIDALVLSDKYDLILRKDSVFYGHELYDVTAKITEKMNALEK